MSHHILHVENIDIFKVQNNRKYKFNNYISMVEEKEKYSQNKRSLNPKDIKPFCCNKLDRLTLKNMTACSNLCRLVKSQPEWSILNGGN